MKNPTALLYRLSSAGADSYIIDRFLEDHGQRTIDLFDGAWFLEDHGQ